MKTITNSKRAFRPLNKPYKMTTNIDTANITFKISTYGVKLTPSNPMCLAFSLKVKTTRLHKGL